MKLPARNAPSLKRTSRQVFPTPESPTSITWDSEQTGTFNGWQNSEVLSECVFGCFGLRQRRKMIRKYTEAEAKQHDPASNSFSTKEISSLRTRASERRLCVPQIFQFNELRLQWSEVILERMNCFSSVRHAKSAGVKGVKSIPHDETIGFTFTQRRSSRPSNFHFRTLIMSMSWVYALPLLIIHQSNEDFKSLGACSGMPVVLLHSLLLNEQCCTDSKKSKNKNTVSMITSVMKHCKRKSLNQLNKLNGQCINE